MHTENWNQLNAIYKANQLPTFWIFSGIKGVGKAQFAKKWVLYVLRSATETHTNLQIIEPMDSKKDIAVGDIERVRKFLAQTHEGWRFVIIDEADRLNQHAANALLKSFEAPYSKTMIILIVHAWDLLLPTIRSRFHKLDFFPVEHYPDDLIEYKDYAGGSMYYAHLLRELGGVAWIEQLSKSMGNKVLPEEFIKKHKDQAMNVLYYMGILLYRSVIDSKKKKPTQLYERLNRFMGELKGTHLNGEDILRTAFLLTR